MTSLEAGAGLRERFATLPDGRRLRYAEGGESGPLVVLESGMGASGAGWAAVQRSLAHRARTIAYDRSGSGGSDPDRQERTLDRLAEDLVAFLGVVAPDEKAVLVGHSWGGPTVRLAADLAPERVDGLVVVDGSTPGALRKAPKGSFTGMFGFLALAVRLRATWVADRAMQSHDWPELTVQDRELVLRDFRSVAGLEYARTEARRIVASFPTMDRIEATPSPVPTLHLVGGRPEGSKALRALMREGAERAAALSPRSRVHVVEDARHQMLWERPTETARLVGELLDEVESG